jgi:hypothetical protein
MGDLTTVKYAFSLQIIRQAGMVEKNEKLYECLLKTEREKIALLEEMLNNK